jgi:hypothetical protein
MPSENSKPWAEIDKRKKLSLWLLAGFLPAVILLGGIGVSAFGSAIPMVVVAAVWGLGLLVAGRRYATWPCPRCGKQFSTSPGHNQGFFVKQCVHCGLAKYADTAS